MYPDKAALTRRYVENAAGRARATPTRAASAAAIYTQVTDVEHEVNGFFTYDRQVEKMDFAQVRAVNQADHPGRGRHRHEPVPSRRRAPRA